MLDTCVPSPAPINSLVLRRCPIDLAEVGGSETKLDLVGLGVFCVSPIPGLKLKAGRAVGLELRRDLCRTISSKIGCVGLDEPLSVFIAAPGLKEKAGKGGGPVRVGCFSSAVVSGSGPVRLECCSWLMLFIDPGLNVKPGRGAILGFREVLRECIGLAGTGISSAVSNGVWTGTAAGIETEAMIRQRLGNDV